ncbi:MAG: hypothetical protein AB7P18_15425 [Candidatus Binatia bacterium]
MTDCVMLVVLLGSGCTARPSPSVSASLLSPAPDHFSLARYYQEESLRLIADSGRHSALAVQYTGKGVSSGADASLWRELADYSIVLALYELNAARAMVALALIHRQLEKNPRPPVEERGPP